MSSAPPPHPTDEILLRLIDEDLPPAEGLLVGDHLAVCRACRLQLEEVRETLGEYLQFHETVLRTALPPPPKPWGLELRSTIAPVPVRRPRARLFSFGPRQWLVAAAVMVLVLLLVRRFERAPGVKASELLRRAASAEQSAPARPHAIRVQTRRHRWDRAAGQTVDLSSPETAEIRQLFQAAGYSWEDPLSARTFSRWHDRLSDSLDQVSTLSSQGVLESYVIHTMTTANPLSDASLTLSAADLHAVACTLRFGAAETVEITELPDGKPAARAETTEPAPPALQPLPGTAPEKAAGPGDELAVIAALHRIGADLGEPIDVKREGPHVLVNATGADTRRQEQVRSALSGLPAARLQFGQIEPRESRETHSRPMLQVDTADALLSELQASSPTVVSTADLADQLTDLTENIIERVYALRGLARRFPAGTTGQMTPPETSTLHEIIRDHARALADSTAAARRLLSPILPAVDPAAVTGDRAWQDLAEALLADARRLDQALHVAAAPRDSAARKERAARALADIDQRLARLTALARP